MHYSLVPGVRALRADLKRQLEQQLAEARERERKERDAREKLDKDVARERAERADLKRQLEQQLAEAKERRAREEREAQEREKLAAGPDMPSALPAPIFCPQLDEIRAGADHFVHCAVQPALKAKEVVFHYRPAGVAQYNALVLARSRKGWLTALIPASRLAGKVLQHYVEARGAGGELVAATGKAGSPNIATLLPAAGAAPTAAESRANDRQMAAMAGASGRPPAPVKARAPRSKRPKARAR
jgi:hypothetical protein